MFKNRLKWLPRKLCSTDLGYSQTHIRMCAITLRCHLSSTDSTSKPTNRVRPSPPPKTTSTPQPREKESPRTHALPLPHAFNLLQPPNSPLNKLLRHRLQLVLMQPQIINRPNPAETQARKSTAAPVHQCSADAAERASHGVAGANSGTRRVGGELVEAAGVGEGGGFDRDLKGGGGWC